MHYTTCTWVLDVLSFAHISFVYPYLSVWFCSLFYEDSSLALWPEIRLRQETYGKSFVTCLALSGHWREVKDEMVACLKELHFSSVFILSISFARRRWWHFRGCVSSILILMLFARTAIRVIWSPMAFSRQGFMWTLGPAVIFLGVFLAVMLVCLSSASLLVHVEEGVSHELLVTSCCKFRMLCWRVCSAIDFRIVVNVLYSKMAVSTRLNWLWSMRQSSSRISQPHCFGVNTKKVKIQCRFRSFMLIN